VDITVQENTRITLTVQCTGLTVRLTHNDELSDELNDKATDYVNEMVTSKYDAINTYTIYI